MKKCKIGDVVATKYDAYIVTGINDDESIYYCVDSKGGGPCCYLTATDIQEDIIYTQEQVIQMQDKMSAILDNNKSLKNLFFNKLEFPAIPMTINDEELDILIKAKDILNKLANTHVDFKSTNLTDKNGNNCWELVYDIEMCSNAVACRSYTPAHKDKKKM